jgi:hypothetical protein
MPIAPAPHACGPAKNEAPPGVLACFAGFTSFTPGSAENLAACLGGIALADACDDAKVTSCLQKTYSEACTSPSVANACKNFGATYCTGQDTLDVSACAARMKPFSTQALAAVAGCIQQASQGTPCQTAFDDCAKQQTGGF